MVQIIRFLTVLLARDVFPNKPIINHLIKKMTFLRQFDCVFELHALAIAKKRINAITLASTIDAVAKSDRPDIDRAMRIFNHAKELKLANSVIYASIIHVISQSEVPNADDALALFCEAKDAGLEDAYVYNAMLSVIAKQAQPNNRLAWVLYNQVVNAGFADAVTYNTTLLVFAHSRNPNKKWVVDLFSQALVRGFVDAYTFASTILALAQCDKPDLDRVLALFNDAYSQGLANTISFNSTLAVISTSNRPQATLALRILSMANELNVANAKTYVYTLDAIAKSDQCAAYQAAANTVLEHGICRFNLKDFCASNPINLAGLSFGEVFFGLKRWSQLNGANQAANDITLTYDRGLDHAMPPLTTLKAMLKGATGFEIIENLDKEQGAVVSITIKRRLSTSSPDCFFTPKEPIIINSSLPANAPAHGK